MSTIKTNSLLPTPTDFVSRKLLREQLVEYLGATHPKKIHREASKTYVYEIYARCIKLCSEGIADSKSNKLEFKCEVDFWKEVTDYNSDKKIGVTGKLVKDALRDYLFDLQDGRCCYCKRGLMNTPQAKPIEHILPKSVFPQYTFHFWNLSVACVDCNQIKSNADWEGLDNMSLVYPRPEKFAKSFHPRLHKYERHIEYTRNEKFGACVVIYKGLTSQGEKICRDMLYLIAGKEMLMGTKPDFKKNFEVLVKENKKLKGNDMNALKDFVLSLSKSAMDLIREKEGLT